MVLCVALAGNYEQSSGAVFLRQRLPEISFCAGRTLWLHERSSGGRSIYSTALVYTTALLHVLQMVSMPHYTMTDTWICAATPQLRNGSKEDLSGFPGTQPCNRLQGEDTMCLPQVQKLARLQERGHWTAASKGPSLPKQLPKVTTSRCSVAQILLSKALGTMQAGCT